MSLGLIFIRQLKQVAIDFSGFVGFE